MLRFKRLEADAPFGTIEEKVIRIVVKDPSHYDKLLLRHNIIDLYLPGAKIPVDFDDLPNEPIAEYLSDENVKLVGVSDLGKISSKYASEGVRGYHDSLESEFGEHYDSINLSTMVAANDGLYHTAHRFQIYLQAPWQTEPHERDGLFLSSSAVELVSVKSRFGDEEYRQLLASLHAPGQMGSNPVFDPALWKVQDASKNIIPVSEWIQTNKKIRDIVGTPSQLPLRGLAVSPLFTPGLWQTTISPHISLYQKVSPHVFVKKISSSFSTSMYRMYHLFSKLFHR